MLVSGRFQRWNFFQTKAILYTSTFQGFALNGCEKRSAVFDSPSPKTGLRVFPWHPFGRSKSHARSRKNAKIPKAKVLDFLFGEEITEEQRRYRFRWNKNIGICVRDGWITIFPTKTWMVITHGYLDFLFLYPWVNHHFLTPEKRRI